jgi:hypothetical protein
LTVDSLKRKARREQKRKDNAETLSSQRKRREEKGDSSLRSE